MPVEMVAGLFYSGRQGAVQIEFRMLANQVVVLVSPGGVEVVLNRLSN